MRTFQVGDVCVGGRLCLVAGPCVIESEEHTLRMAERLLRVSARIPVVFKASFDKANRTSRSSYRGPGLEAGLRILERVRLETGLPVTTDLHLPEQAAPVAEVVDLLQIPAFLCRQTDLLVAAARTGRPVSVKKGQFLAPGAMRHVVEKLEGAAGILLFERGSSFGHGDLVVDFRGLVDLMGLGWPVGLDATHAVQRPPTEGGTTGGDRRYIAPLARAAVAVGARVIFVETHDDPDHALSDGPNQLPVDALPALVEDLLALERSTRRCDLEVAS